MTEPRKTPRCYAMVMKCHGIPAEFVRGGFGKPRFVLAEDACALEIETQELAEALASLLESALAIIGEPPERNCSCHLSPPCNDCVDHNFTREMLENARDALARHRAKQEVKRE